MPNLAIVTGGAGFIGSHVVDDLLSKDWHVTVLDNFSTGRDIFLKASKKDKKLRVFRIDLFKEKKLGNIFEGCKRVYHLSANADVRFGPLHPNKDLEQNTIVTQKVLEASRIAGVEEFIFSSTGSVYGEAKVIPTPEDAPFPIQTSLYGASKLAGEGLVEAYSEAFGLNSYIFRFVSILGPRYSHGHVFDFFKQLHSNKDQLKVLGDGSQRKSYLHVNDCVRAINTALDKPKSKLEIFNLGTDEFCDVRSSIKWICEELNLNPRIEYGKENRGWIGDNPFIQLKTEKIRSLGWKPLFSIEESIRDTINYLKNNKWLLKA